MGSVFGVGDVVSQRHGQGSAMGNGVVMGSIMGFLIGIPKVCHRRKQNRICVKTIARCKLFKLNAKNAYFYIFRVFFTVFGCKIGDSRTQSVKKRQI